MSGVGECNSPLQICFMTVFMLLIFTDYCSNVQYIRYSGDEASDVEDELNRMTEGLREAPLRFLDYAGEAAAGPDGDGSGGAPPSLN